MTLITSRASCDAKQHLSNANMAEWNQVSGHWPYRGNWRWLSLMWPGQLFRHTLILSFLPTAIAHDWTVDSLLQLYRTISRDIGPGPGPGWLISIHQGQDLDPIALLDIQLTISWTSSQVLHYNNPQVRTLCFHWTGHCILTLIASTVSFTEFRQNSAILKFELNQPVSFRKSCGCVKRKPF